MKRLAAFLLVACGGGTQVVEAPRAAHPAGPPPVVENGQPAIAKPPRAAGPRFALTTLDGRAVTSESLTGKIVVIHVFATWCEPCKKRFASWPRSTRGTAPKG